MPIKEKPLEILSNGKKVFAYNDKGQAICNGIIRRPGEPERRCQVTILGTCGRCRKHGDRAPKGITHYAAKSLKTSETMPQYLRADMNAALADEDKLSTDHEIALTDTKISQLKKSLGQDLSNAAWKDLKLKISQLTYYLENDQEKITEEFLGSLINIVNSGISEKDTWNEIRAWSEHKRKLTETGSKREKELRLLLRGEQVDALIIGIAAAARDSIKAHHSLLARKYKLVDIDTGRPVTSIDIKYENHFTASIGSALGKLIGKSRESQQLQLAEPS